MNPVKVLAVGNSFSENVASCLPQIAEAGNRPLILGRLYIGGCSLERHWQNVLSGAKDYLYNHTGREQIPTSISDAFKMEDWDFVTFQQASHFSGMPETYHPFLENLSAYAKVMSPRAKQVIHETWAYAKDSTHPGFANYHNSQEEMYRRLRDAYHMAADTIGAAAFLPAGDAWQLARATEIGDTLCADGFHGNEKGCYLSAAVWYEILLGGDIRENSFCPNNVTEKELKILQDCAHQAAAQTTKRFCGLPTGKCCWTRRQRPSKGTHIPRRSPTYPASVTGSFPAPVATGGPSISGGMTIFSSSARTALAGACQPWMTG